MTIKTTTGKKQAPVNIVSPGPRCWQEYSKSDEELEYKGENDRDEFERMKRELATSSKPTESHNPLVQNFEQIVVKVIELSATRRRELAYAASRHS